MKTGDLTKSNQQNQDPDSPNRIAAGLTLTDLFLDSVLQLPLLPFDIAEQIDLQDMSAFVEACVTDWDDIVTSNWRFLTAFVFGAVMIIVSLIAAVGFCCARYPTKPNDPRLHD